MDKEKKGNQNALSGGDGGSGGGGGGGGEEQSVDSTAKSHPYKPHHAPPLLVAISLLRCVADMHRCCVSALATAFRLLCRRMWKTVQRATHGHTDFDRGAMPQRLARPLITFNHCLKFANSKSSACKLTGDNLEMLAGAQSLLKQSEKCFEELQFEKAATKPNDKNCAKLIKKISAILMQAHPPPPPPPPAVTS